MISEIIEKWIKGILIDGITGNLSGLFDNVNAKVGEIASDVGSTPQAWNSGIFNMLRSLSETVVLPIAAAILALVMCHELIQMITEKNNMHDFDTSMFFRWIFKSAFAILIVSNTWNIVMGVFDATQSVVNQSSGVIIGETSIHFDRLIPGLEFQLESMTIGSLLSLWFQTLVVGLTMNILSICIFLVTYGRMIEIYVVTALGPIPLATMGSSEWRSTGQNYLKSLVGVRLPSVPDYDCRGHLCGADTQHFRCSGHCRGHLGLHGLHRAALFLSVQDRQHQQVGVWCPLRPRKEKRMAYVTVPKDLTHVKSKVLFGLTKRQLVCFGGALLTGGPLYFLTRDYLSNSAAALLMIFAMLPGLLFALFERHGQPLEVVIQQMIQCCFIRPKERPYQTNNAYAALVRQYQMEQEVKAIVQKNDTPRNRKAQKAHPRPEKRN